jgi:hypothetical protein
VFLSPFHEVAMTMCGQGREYELGVSWAVPTKVESQHKPSRDTT